MSGSRAESRNEQIDERGHALIALVTRELPKDFDRSMLTASRVAHRKETMTSRPARAHLRSCHRERGT